MPGPRGICYVCSSPIDLAGCIPDAEARGALVAIAEAVGGEFGRVIVRYIALFAPEKSVMSWSAFRTRTAELGELVAAGRVEWEGVIRPATRAYWQEGAEIILGKPDLSRPLKNHNLLRKIVFGIADKKDASAERMRHENALAGRRHAPDGHSPQGVAPPEPRPSDGVAAIRELAGDVRSLQMLYTQIAASNMGDPRLAELQQQIDEKRARLNQLKRRES